MTMNRQGRSGPAGRHAAVLQEDDRADSRGSSSAVVRGWPAAGRDGIGSAAATRGPKYGAGGSRTSITCF
jgi:hypothetical protein